MRSLIIFIISIFIYLPQAKAVGICDRKLESFPVLSQGRVKPYLVMAQESIRLITGKTTVAGVSATKLTCMLSMESLGIDSMFKVPLMIEHVKVKKFLDIDQNRKSLPAKELLNKKSLIRSEIMQQKQTTSYKKALNKLFFRIDTFEKLINGQLWTVVNLSLDKNETIDWIPVSQAFEGKNATQMYEYLQASSQKYQDLKGDTFLLELSFVKSHIFSIAMALAILGIFLTVLFKKPTFGLTAAILTLITEVIGITMRVMISGRAPITNMYETVLFSGFGALVIALIIFIFKKDRIFILGGLGYNILCLFMMKFAHGMLDSSISPLVPVLRDNFWLSTHVTTIMLSYAALALSWLLAMITLGKQRFVGISTKDYRYYEGLIYTSIKVGVVLLSAGIILGGVWADYSWGRFWGWDPKETWSLIVLLFYIAVLHGKSTSWINTHRFIMLSAAGFMSVMMAWFGVNYILATGLHSYGFSEGGAIFLGSFFAFQIFFLIITGKHNKKDNISKQSA